MYRVNALSEVGLVRKDNEDSYLVSVERGLFVVADGMGGHAGGQLASETAIQVLDREILPPSAADNCEEILFDNLLKANNIILSKAQDEEYFGMGTTVTAAMFNGGSLYIAHIGDSRAYLFREGNLKLLTLDHSLVNELLQKGELTLEEAQNHPRRNILTRALGTIEFPQIDLFDLPVQSGDIFLLCTDGLYNQLEEEELTQFLSGVGSLQESVKKMVDLALERGGNDNITVVLVQYEAEGE